MRSGAKAAVIGGAFIVVAGGVGWGAYNVLDGITGGGGDGGTSNVSSKNEVKSGPLSSDEVDKTAKDFLKGWAAGSEPTDVAQLTNNPADAATALDGYRAQAHVTKAVITPGKATGATVPFTVRATVSLGGKTKPWSYSSKLTVVRGLTTGRPLVDWLPTVIHPKLTKTSHLVTSEAPTPPIKAVDRNGKELTKAKYPSLGPILDALREKYGADAGGTSGVELQIQSDGDSVPGTTLLTLSKGKAGKLRTTLDANVQGAAERAVKEFGEASVAAVRPSTGDILAVANNRTDGFNAAMLGKQAPGSTMKIITAAMLMEKGLTGPGRPSPCPPTVMYEGRTFKNDGGFSIPNGTLTQAFARSCNTSFIKWIDDVKTNGRTDEGALKKEAEEVFGLGMDNWKTGVTSFDGSVPFASGGEAAAQYIGQGTVQMNVLNMASVAATAKNGTFRQPVVVPQSLDGRDLAHASRSLPGSVAQGLRDMMNVTATSGTGAQAMASLSGYKGAKTGSAEVDGQHNPNSWFVGFQEDCAAAAVVQAGGHGADAAGPVVAKVLAAD
ncbi:penicillin-binding transpeptidase domain-containing protein [Streptomyces sp. NBC_00370]|uniref:penicillin-binding transpeptidase domain-containing protein n=1 Tax=Streptomyces sp. NBC_00370 TaxID=2975728 RepID=UPI002E25936E